MLFGMGGSFMTYRKRLSILILVDSTIVLSAIFFSQYLLDTQHLFTTFLMVTSMSLLVGHHVFAHIFRLYKKAWSYASIGELLSIFKAITLTIAFAGLVQLLFYQDIYFRALAVTWMIHMLLLGGSRFAWRLYRDAVMTKNEPKNRALIIGAGAAGTMVVRQLLQNNGSELKPVAFIDDDKRKQDLEIMGVPVYGGVCAIEKAVEVFQVNHIVIAIPSLNKKEINRIFQECSKTKAKTKILPAIEDLMLGKVSVNQFRDVQVEDLLGRDPIELDMETISDSITNRVVLVTGAGGSIGSEICRQVAKFRPSQLILLGHGENSIYTIEMELREGYDETIEIVTEIADVQDRTKMFAIMEKHKPDVVYHAAAHKHVPLMERNPEEAVKNNVIGTKNVAEAASTFGIGTFVMVSTDKAVNPTSVMGATKRMAEMVVQHMDTVSNTRFVAVRFGNVLGSRGSVIPLFKKQIQKGGPVTVTHPDMVRYFMTIPEASRLVIQAGALARGGEIFVLDMGEPVKIVDLAKNLIKLSGYSEDEIGIQFSGVRPGEKLFEELLSKDEVHDEQVYPKIYIGKSNNPDIKVVLESINQLETLAKDELREKLLGIANGKGEEKKRLTVVK